MATVNKKKASKKKASKKSATMQIESMFDSMHMASARAFAMNAGDLSMFVRQDVARIMDEQHNNQARAIKVGIDQLLAVGHISRQEAKDLEAISRHVFRSTRDNADVAGACMQVHAMYKDMVMSGKSSPVALAIASAASAALREQAAATLLPKGAITALVGPPGNAGVSALVGGVVGGVVGGITGGELGAGFGAALGAATGAAIRYCGDMGV